MRALEARIVALRSKGEITIEGARPGNRPIVYLFVQAKPRHVVASALDVMTTNRVATMHLTTASMSAAVEAENVVREFRTFLLPPLSPLSLR